MNQGIKRICHMWKEKPLLMWFVCACFYGGGRERAAHFICGLNIQRGADSQLLIEFRNVDAVITLIVAIVLSAALIAGYVSILLSGKPALRTIGMTPIIALALCVSVQTVADNIERRELYEKCGIIGRYLQNECFDSIEIVSDEDMIICKSNENRETDGKQIQISEAHRDTLRYVSEKIKTVWDFDHGKVFVYGYSWDTDAYAYYVSDTPDEEWLENVSGRQMSIGIWDVTISLHVL